MPLDPYAQALLDLQQMTGFRGFDTLPVAEARAMMTARMADVPREPVPRVENLSTDTGIPIRLYWPHAEPDSSSLRPALVFSHGGGWILGDCDMVDGTCRSLANASECVVASVDYRLAPEHRFPTAAEDAYHAFRWVRAQADRLGIDPHRVAVGGDSAGGNLAIVSCLMARDRGEPAPAFQLLIYPVADSACNTPSYSECATGFGLTRNAMQYYWQQYLADPADGTHPYASPLRADLTGLPPAFVLTAEYDPLRDEGEALAQRLTEAGVATRHRRFDGQIHGFFHLGHIMPQGKDAVAEAAQALRQALA
ncbi:alpha/beta hydrolase [Tautonia marina]|uniref:alpha/beta hydrolase n=1 Tax=Tautonia marina TaxID=2653855 RepID=UPI001260FD07|nr:alpha/beta hydrolase [Tautonia marina]